MCKYLGIAAHTIISGSALDERKEDLWVSLYSQSKLNWYAPDSVIDPNLKNNQKRVD